MIELLLFVAGLCTGADACAVSLNDPKDLTQPVYDLYVCRIDVDKEKTFIFKTTTVNPVIQINTTVAPTDKCPWLEQEKNPEYPAVDKNKEIAI